MAKGRAFQRGRRGAITHAPATTYLPGQKTGRPTSLTPETTAAFLDALTDLNTYEDACTAAGIGYTTFKQWMRKGRKAKTGEHHDFYVQVVTTLAKAKAGLVKVVAEAGRKDPKYALRVLERRYPAEWGRQLNIDANVHTPPKPKEDPRAKLAARMEAIEARMLGATAPPASPGGTDPTKAPTPTP